MQILKFILYLLAVLVLAAGLYTGTALWNEAHSLSTSLNSVQQPLQIFGGVPGLNALVTKISNLVTYLGDGVMALSVILCLTLFGSGRLVGRVINLERRMARLESR